MAEHGPQAPGRAVDPPVDDGVRRRLADLETECGLLRQRLAAEVESSREVLSAHAEAQARVAELEGILTGVQAAKERSEAEGADLQARLGAAIEAERERREHEQAAAEARVAELESRLHALEEEADAALDEHERRRTADVGRIQELERELDAAARRVSELETEALQARKDVKPRAARRLAEVQAQLDSEQAARTELEARLAEVTETHRAALEAHAEQSAEARARIGQLEAELDGALRTGADEHGRAQGLVQRLTAAEAELEEVRGERDTAQDLGSRLREELDRTRSEHGARAQQLEQALQGERDLRAAAEAAREGLEQRLAARDEAERARRAAQESERRVAQAHHAALSRAAQRLTEIAGGLAISAQRLRTPSEAARDDGAATAEVALRDDAATAGS